MKRRGVTFALALLTLLLIGTITDQRPPERIAATTEDTGYAYDILPGIQPAGATPEKLTLTCGWHGACLPGDMGDLALDMAASAGDRVYAAIRARDYNARVRAQVTFAVTDQYLTTAPDFRRCRRVEVDAGDGSEAVTLEYTHIVPSIGQDTYLNMPMGASTVATRTPLGTITADPWRYMVEGGALDRASAGLPSGARQNYRLGNDVYRVWNTSGLRRYQPVWTPATGTVLTAAKNNATLTAGVSETRWTRYGTEYGKKVHMRVGGQQVRVWATRWIDAAEHAANLATVRYYQQAVHATEDTTDCAIIGSHLHQGVDLSLIHI